MTRRAHTARRQTLRTLLAVLGGAALVGSGAIFAPAQAALPTVYLLGAGAQGMTSLFTFSGSTVDPLINGASPYTSTSLSSNASPAGLATVAYPGTLGLIYQDSFGLVFSSYPEAQPLGAELGYMVPKYPLVARADGRERNSNVGGPTVTNNDGAMSLTGGRQQCLVEDDDSSVSCSALIGDAAVPMTTAIPAPGAAAFAAWRDGLVSAVRAAVPASARTNSARTNSARTNADSERGVFASAAHMKSTSFIDAGAEPARSEATVVLDDVSLLDGAVHFDSITQRFLATSDGTKGAAEAAVQVVGAAIGGVPVTFGPDGLSIADTEGLSAKQIADSNRQLQGALDGAGLTLRLGRHKNASEGSTGSVAGDGMFFEAAFTNQSTTYRVGGWLASGRASATRSADEAEGAESLESGGGSVLVAGPRQPQAPAGVAGSTRSRLMAAPVSASTDTSSPVAAPVVPEPAVSQPADRLQVVPASATSSAGGGGGHNFDRDTIIALFGICQFLGVAALAAWGLKVTRAARAS